MTGQVIEPLSGDEQTVLEIASQGESMIPIGRWEAPTLRLAALGLLRALDASNYVITSAGRERMKAVNADYDDALRQMVSIGRRLRAQQIEATPHAPEESDGDPD